MTEETERIEKALVPVSQPQVPTLSIADERLVKAARTARWRPEVMLARIEKALPAPIEQQLYLQLASDFRFHPESMSKILRTLLGEQELKLHHLERHEVGNNLVISKFDQISDQILQVLYLTRVAALEDMSYAIGVEDATELVMLFGDHADNIITNIWDNIEEIRERLGFRATAPGRRVFKKAVRFLIEKATVQSTRPQALDIMEYFERSNTQYRGEG